MMYFSGLIKLPHIYHVLALKHDIIYSTNAYSHTFKSLIPNHFIITRLLHLIPQVTKATIG